MVDQDIRVRSGIMAIRGQHPFFGTLALYAEVKIDSYVQTAGTDGKRLWLNPDFLKSLSRNELCGLLVHELLHMALLHCSRRGEKDPYLWNLAADIVVNGIIRQHTNYALPRGAFEDQNLAILSVEEVYEQLQRRPMSSSSELIPDLLQAARADPMSQGYDKHLTTYWRNALCQASAIAQQIKRGYGKHGLGAHRDITCLVDPQINWREALWTYLVQTPFDYSGYDRRFIWQGLYLDGICGESVRIALAIDTSASVIYEELQNFMSEVNGITSTYPHLEVELYYTDTELHGPYELMQLEDTPVPLGGGGTSIIPFFTALQEYPPDLCIYFTDGYGAFPEEVPGCDVLWVVSYGGLGTDNFPFGEVIRMAGG